jgi:hypothetical protein
MNVLLDILAAPSGALGALQNSENPTLNLSLLALIQSNLKVEEISKAAITVRPAQPFGRRKSILLVSRSPFASESPAPKRRVDLRDNRPIGRYGPTVKRPEMHVVFGVLPDVAQPRDSCVRGLGYRTLHVEMERGLGCTCPRLGHPPPASIA